MTKREALRSLIFGSTSLPTGTPTVYSESSPPVALTGAASVSRLEFISNGLLNKSYLYIPATPNGKAMIVHQGHSTGYFGEAGIAETCQAFLSNGFVVVLCGMPGYNGNQGSATHGTYNSLAPFVGHVIAAINHLAGYEINMVGLSGGGWTTVVCAAIDERIKTSIPVAGSLPMAYRGATTLSGSDWEQTAVVAVLDYPGLYALGASGEGRHQRAVHNRNDACCFGRDGERGAYGLNYDANVAQVVNAAASISGGAFSFSEDTSHSDHKISTWALNNAILPLFGITPPPPPPDITIDDGAAGFSLIGTEGTPNTPGQTTVWTPWTYPTKPDAGLAVDADYRTCPPQSISGSELMARYTFTVPPGNYELSASWIGHSNRASNAKYRVYDGATLLTTFTINQQGAIVYLAGVLGTVFASSGTLIVELTNNGANGYIVADAVRARGL